MKLKVPRWILVLSGFFTLLEIMVSIILFFAPESVAENVDLKAKGVDYLMQTWAIRQLALGVIFGFATFKKSNAMLTIAYIFFLVMMLGDVWIGIVQHNSGLLFTASMMVALAIFILLSLKRNNKL